MGFEDNIDNQNIILNNLPKITKAKLIDDICDCFIYICWLLKLYSYPNIKI